MLKLSMFLVNIIIVHLMVVFKNVELVAEGVVIYLYTSTSTLEC